MTSNEDRDFLEDQVRRLNIVLNQYRAKYPPLKDEEQIVQNLDPSLIQITTDRSLITPLIQEYEDTITLLRNENHYYKSQIETLKSRTEEIIHENKSLYSELKQATLSAAADTKSTTATAAVMPADTPADLRDRFQSLAQEKDRYVQLWQIQSQDIKSLRQQFEQQSQELQKKALDLIAAQEELDDSLRGTEELKQENRRLKSEYQKLVHNNKLQVEEIESTQNELRKYKAELRTSQASKQEMKRLLDNVSDRMKDKEKQVEQASYRDRTTEVQIQEMQRKLVEMDARFKTSIGEVNRLHLERGELEERLALIQKRGADHEQREYEAVKRVRDSIQLVENAMLERDQALIKEQQKNLDVMRLQEEMSRLITKNKEKTREETEAIRKQHTRTITKLSEDMQSLEFELDERKLEIEKLQREKKLLEQELLKASNEPSEEVRSYNHVEQYQTRACIAERARDEALLKVDQLQVALRSMDNSFREDRNHFVNQNEDLKQRLKQLQTECEGISENRLKILGRVDSLQRELKIAQQKQLVAEQKCLKEVAALENRMRLREKEFAAQLKNSEEISWESSQEIRRLLLSQQRATTKWREEAKVMTNKYEIYISQSRTEMQKLKQRNEELVSSTRATKNTVDELTRKLKETHISESRLQRAIQEAEDQIKNSSQQISTLLSRERQLLDERKLLLKEIDKLKLELGRSFRDQPTRRYVVESSNFYGADSNLHSTFQLKNAGSAVNRSLLTDLPANTQKTFKRHKTRDNQKDGNVSKSSTKSQLLDNSNSSRASSEVQYHHLE